MCHTLWVTYWCLSTCKLNWQPPPPKKTNNPVAAWLEQDYQHYWRWVPFCLAHNLITGLGPENVRCCKHNSIDSKAVFRKAWNKKREWIALVGWLVGLGAKMNTDQENETETLNYTHFWHTFLFSLHLQAERRQQPLFPHLDWHKHSLSSPHAPLSERHFCYHICIKCNHMQKCT